jgi:hypothetical protein
MDFTAVSVTRAQSELEESARVLVLKKAMDESRQEGQLVDKIISGLEVPESCTSQLGGNLDKYI